MITNVDYEYVPRYSQVVYLPEGLALRDWKVARWYAYLKWRISLQKKPYKKGMIESAEYVFPRLEFPFTFTHFEMKFLPDFEIKYVGSYHPEYQTFSYIKGNYGRMLRTMLHKYPFITIRVIEPIEFRRIMKNFEESGAYNHKDFKKEEILSNDRKQY